MSNPLHFSTELEQAAKRGDQSACDFVIASLSHSDVSTRLFAARMIGRAGIDSAVPDLLRSLDDSDASVRQAAAWSLGSLKNSLATTSLQGALNDADPVVRRTAIWALAQIADSSAVNDLIAVRAADPSQDVRRAASVAIRALSRAHTGKVGKPAGNRARTRGRDRGWIAVGLLVLVAGIAVTFGLLVWWKPLGPSLIKSDGESAGAFVDASSASDSLPAMCDGPNTMTILMVGIDSGDEGYEAGFTDVIRVARIDFRTPSVILLAIPRDLWVTVPGLTEYGISENRLKTAYTYGNHYEVPGGGMSLLAQTLYINFGLSVDHYMAVDFTGFASGIDALGGIDVNLTFPVGDPRDADAYFPAGLQHLDGQRALAFARIRPDNTSDLQRIDRQTAIIMAVRDRLLSAQGAAGLPELVASMQSATHTDLSPSQVNSLVCVGQKIERSNLIAATLNPKLYVAVTDPFGYERLLPNIDAIRAAIKEFMAGNASGAADISGS